jgi:hypothetical protein
MGYSLCQTQLALAWLVDLLLSVSSNVINELIIFTLYVKKANNKVNLSKSYELET